MRILVTTLLILLSSIVFAQTDVSDCMDNIKVPKSFTPNGDGANDVLKIEFPCPAKKFEFQVLNRWGQVIYSSKNPAFEWDGKDANNNNLELGVYHWRIIFKYQKTSYTKEGQFTLIR
ncbi:gliding motility-associated C-terminal domain-containing protein [Paracrocinitomix mangrovi]|uniref:T9SS type B sorting domain-containing protein n=1 Tax=Paracrocinitomix mangrovi TaxID=2862509 RepID=UPI001C8D4FFB|nr:gliding motility-associated C-terminal domain-containing protein [Paracrocinitomix mangrovi]UKN00423.1 gliding motility-associated C-terminal domain-containing protein [Paracrocinitomix mangrovi]